jgi:glutamyl-tRNA reductase
VSASLIVVGMNHRTAPVELRERLAVAPEALGQAATALGALPHVREVVFVATCNRIEVYAATDDVADEGVAAIREFLVARDPSASVADCLYEHRGPAAVRHLFRVAASLDSMVVGEPQILGQVKEAFAAARSAGTLGPALSRTLARAFTAAKRVRTETSIGTGSVSIASVAVDLAQQIFGDLRGRRVLLLGAGKMAIAAARALGQHGSRLAVANRSYERAVEIARAHGGDAHPLGDLELLLPHADVVLCSTGAARFVVTREMVQVAMRARRGRALFLVDIAVPRNVDPRVHDMDSVYLFDVDDLERQVARALNSRGGVLEAAERILEEELSAFDREQRTGAVVPTIASLRERFRITARAELERSLSGKLKHLGDGDRRALESMVDAMVNKLLHAPTAALRAQGATAEGPALASIVQALFQLPAPAEATDEPGGGGRGGHGGASGEEKP